jgi:pyrimidine deaminase RibD-like protein
MLTSKDYRLYGYALRKAATSNMYPKFAAVVVKGGRIQGIARNERRFHAEHKHWPEIVTSIHAEHNVLRKCKAKNATMYVAHLGGNGRSRPCRYCMEYLKEAGVHTVVYFDGSQLCKLKVGSC